MHASPSTNSQSNRDQYERLSIFYLINRAGTQSKTLPSANNANIQPTAFDPILVCMSLGQDLWFVWFSMVGLGACGKIPTHCKPLRVGFGFPFRDWAGKSGEFSIASLVVALTLRCSSREIWNRIYFELYFFPPGNLRIFSNFTELKIPVMPW